MVVLIKIGHNMKLIEINAATAHHTADSASRSAKGIFPME
jgi:hypothetical protein